MISLFSSQLKKIILISQSPRRKQLLEELGIPIQISPIDIDETIHSGETPIQYSLRIAREKLHTYLKNRKLENDNLYVAADTIVVLNKTIMQKPINKEDAFKMLYLLSGRKHYVYTGVAFRINQYEKTFFEKTGVWFKHLTEQEIKWYVDSEEPMDKAGAYGIQGLGKIFIQRVEGCYFNVVGFPMNQFYEQLKTILGDKHA